MVAFICPYCGSGGDGTPDSDDIAQWYADHHPDLPVGSTIPTVCGDCAHDYVVGDRVVRRSEPTSHVYIVTGFIRSTGNPNLIVVRHPNGHELDLAISAIRLVAQPNVVDPSPAKRAEGYF